MPSNIETMGTQINDLKSFHENRNNKQNILNNVLKRKLIGNSCPELFFSENRTNLNPNFIIEKDLQGEIDGNEKEPEHKNHTRPRFCLNPEINYRFPMDKLYRALNLSGKEVSIMGIHINRKSAQETVKALGVLLVNIENGLELHEKNQKRLTKYLEIVKKNICSEPRFETPSGLSHNNNICTKECNEMMSELVSSGCFGILLRTLPLLDFEDRKTVCFLFCNGMRRQAHSNHCLVRYLEENKDILFSLISGYREQRIALVAGLMVRECIKFESLARIMLYSKQFNEFFEFLQEPVFEISSDAFVTFRNFLTEHKKLTADFLVSQYEDFFQHFNAMLTCDNYVTQLSSLRFLSTLLLERHNYNMMTKYVGDPKNLKRLMILMKNSHRNIQFEAYHTFKIFVANPKPNPSIAKIFINNKERLIKFLNEFQPERENELFADEKDYLIKQLDEKFSTVMITQIETSSLPSSE